MNIMRRYQSPNYGSQIRTCEFAIIHYTACDLKRALALLLDSRKKISCHILISKEGRVYELVECFGGFLRTAYHAGESRWLGGGTKWEGFNDFSIGIELENQNGNLLSYSNAQYDALQSVMERLKNLFPSLRSPERILGHEHIADWRGKIDPGHMFDWKRFFSQCYPGLRAPVRGSACPESLRQALNLFLPFAPKSRQHAEGFWHALNHIGETSLSMIAGHIPKP